jgi:hypothetical protein
LPPIKPIAGAETLSQIEDRLPDEWKAVKDWRKTLLQGDWNEYFGQFNLYRHELRRAPRAFASGLVSALGRNPAYVLQQVLKGFPAAPNSRLEEEELIVRKFCALAHPELKVEGLKE